MCNDKYFPIRSTGFILDGFPRTLDEAQYLSERGVCPEVAVYIQVEESDVLDRLFPPRLKKWKERQYKKLENKKKLKDLKAKIRVSFQSCLLLCNFSSTGLNTDCEEHTEKQIWEPEDTAPHIHSIPRFTTEMKNNVGLLSSSVQLIHAGV